MYYYISPFSPPLCNDPYGAGTEFAQRLGSCSYGEPKCETASSRPFKINEIHLKKPSGSFASFELSLYSTNVNTNDVHRISFGRTTPDFVDLRKARRAAVRDFGVSRERALPNGHLEIVARAGTSDGHRPGRASRFKSSAPRVSARVITSGPNVSIRIS